MHTSPTPAFTSYLGAARYEHRRRATATYATLTRWVAALVFLLLLGTALGKLHPGKLALPEPTPAPVDSCYAVWRASSGTVPVEGDNY